MDAQYLRSLSIQQLLVGVDDEVPLPFVERAKDMRSPSIKLLLAVPHDGAPVAQQQGMCVLCGKNTLDWWWYDGKTGACECRSCYREYTSVAWG